MAFFPSWVCVLVGSFSASLAGISNLSDIEPPLWKESPGQLGDYRVENSMYIINPWVYLERMGMYKIILNQTARYFAKFAPENEQNILWGLPLQYGWQYRTGRLADPTRRTNCGYESGDHMCISVDSWWADLNYFLSSLPFLAAVDSGIMGISSDQVRLLPPPKNERKFCYDVSSCRSSFPETMNKWNAFYQYLQSPFSKFDDLLKYLWAAHTSTLADNIKSFEDRYDYYSKAEAHFERNWVLAVDHLAAVLFPTTLIISYKFQKGMPPRILLNTDVAPFISDFTAFQNVVLVLLNMLGNVDKSIGYLCTEKSNVYRGHSESSSGSYGNNS
ncbi:protein LEG1 homolog [Nomascus leucogenys]|uniref:Chromosome 6 open reading frame 58 n=1 Tax=Nomascus leucogenys TaxID=61853 RepID=G1RVE8_NOMLE|nr:protein LEG1 homolog [Nomascus leucogenys]